ncbi:MAG TPA: hypothetical protein VKD90_16610, partial [Gemmataceae bacterium]|nr:hypothetical protein [Gemmataceae bacterium]
MPAPPAARAEDDLLRESLERHLRASLGGPAALAAVARQRCAYASSYDAEVVTARLRTGEEVKVFLKNLGVSHFPKDAAGQRRDRERKVYSDLLPGAGLDTAQSYGSVWDPERGTYWLLLEYLPGTELRFCEFEHWLAAAGWLGRAQGQFAPQADRLGGCDFLVRHDASFFRSKADLALGQVAELYPPLADRLARALDGYDRLIA